MNEHICEIIQTQKQSDTCKLIKFGDFLKKYMKLAKSK